MDSDGEQPEKGQFDAFFDSTTPIDDTVWPTGEVDRELVRLY
jgi:hypothetical protein